MKARCGQIENRDRRVMVNKLWFCGIMLGISLMLNGCVVERILPFMAKPDGMITVSLKGTDIKIGGAPGYCVNKRQSKTGKKTAFVVLGPCDPDTASAKALMVASISAESGFGSKVDIKTLEAFLKSDRGRAMLSSKNDSETVRIGETLESDGVLYVFSHDSAEPVIPETTTDKWRGFFPVSGRIVVISMVNFMENAMPDDEALNQLQSFAAGIKRLNNMN